MQHVVKDRIVVLLDDSIVRGTTAKQLIGLVKSAGAKEVPLPPLSLLSHVFDF